MVVSKTYNIMCKVALNLVAICRLKHAASQLCSRIGEDSHIN
jgi:hypothetical protein